MMHKKLISSVLIIISLISCKEEAPKDYITLKGLIANNKVNHIDITNFSFDKRITVNPDGTFEDTLRVIKQGYQTFNDGKNKTLIHIKNGDVLNMQYDYNDL